MASIALVVIDEAHHTIKKTFYSTIMEYFYYPCAQRPRILALTASPVENCVGTEPSTLEVRHLGSNRKPCLYLSACLPCPRAT